MAGPRLLADAASLEERAHIVATAIEVAKRVLGYYLSLVPTYSVLYGAFATVPILLI